MNLFVLAQLGLGVAQLRPISTRNPITHINVTREECRLHQASPALRKTVLGQQASALTRMEKKEVDAQILTAVELSRISKHTCLPINQNGQKNVRS